MVSSSWSSPLAARFDGQQLETLLRRIGTLATAAVVFGAASALTEQGNIVVNRFTLYLSFVLYAVAFGLVLLTVIRSVSHAQDGLILVALLLVLVAYFHIHEINKLHSGVALTTDVNLFSDYAARLLRAGQNPYGFDLLDTYRVNRVEALFATPTLNGYYAAHVDYPALAFLVYVPFQWLGLPGTWVFPLFLVLVLVTLFLRTPPAFRPVVLLPFFADVRYMNYVLGGVSDIVWAFFLIMMILSWRRTRQAALWFGLACAFKQQPWLLAPFLAVRLRYETDGDARQRFRRVLIFGAIVLGVFLLINLPFIVWDFHAWLAGVAEPFTSPLILLGQGLSNLTVAGIVIVPKWFYSLAFVGVYLLLLVVYTIRFHDMPEALWVLPALALWFGPRSLSSYWYFNLIPLAAALLWMPALPVAVEMRPLVRWRLPRLDVVFGLPALLIMVGLLIFRLTPPSLNLQIGEPIGVVSNFVSFLQMKVTNDSHQSVSPRFSVQSWADQPLFWNIVDGPLTLQPGESGSYTLSTHVPFASFDITRGAVINVTDAVDYGIRASALIPAELNINYPDDIPNGHFVYWQPGAKIPYLWSLQTSTPTAGSIDLNVAGEHGHTLQFTLVPQVGPTYGRVAVSTSLPLPDVPFQIWVKLPDEANRLPNLDVIYGLEMTAQENHILLLFGDENRTGKIGEVDYQMRAVPRGEWSLQTVDVQAVFSSLNVEMTPLRQPMARFDRFDYARIAFSLSLVVQARLQAQAISAEFGEIDSVALHPDPDALIRQRLAHPEIAYLWSADFNAEARNLDAAARDYQLAIQSAADSRPARLAFAEFQLRTGHWQEALALYEALAQAGYQPGKAYNGIGWSNYNLGNDAAARGAFEQAIARLGELPDASTSVDLADAYGGMGQLLLRQGKCLEAAINFEQARARQPNYTLPTDQLALCLNPTH